MGREARCACRWGDREGDVTALLESSEIIVRGGVRAKAPLASLTQVAVRGGNLEFHAGADRVQLTLGAELARRWAEALAKPPPTLARKLGITPDSRVYVAGIVDDEPLRTAIAVASETAATPAESDLAVLRTDDPAALKKQAGALIKRAAPPPVWVVYRKGRGAALSEGTVFEIMRGLGWRDTKVASVSETLTGLRFIKPR
jgi:hypothetical protein